MHGTPELQVALTTDAGYQFDPDCLPDRNGGPSVADAMSLPRMTTMTLLPTPPFSRRIMRQVRTAFAGIHEQAFSHLSPPQRQSP